MKNLITAFLVVGLISIGFIEQSPAQDSKANKKENRDAAAASSLYIISAKAGAVNFVSGKVAVDRKNAKSGYLVKGDNIDKGEKVRTGGEGKAEILLNPGSYVRLSENTDFKFDSTSLDDLQVSLNSGSAIFEVITDNDFNVVVKTPKSSYRLVKSGIYRVDALSDGSGKVSVWKGKATFGEGKNAVVKGGQTTAIINGQVSVEKFDRHNKGEFELWSKDRAKEIAKVNAKLQQRTMSRSLISSFSQNGWGNTNRLGLWVFDPFSRGFCFLPFGYGWSSPYGFGFNQTIWDYRLPNAIYNNVNPNWNNIRNQQQNQNNNFPPPNNGNANPRPGMPGGNNSAPPMSAPMERPNRIESLNPDGGGGRQLRVKQMPIID